jgi:protein TonB
MQSLYAQREWVSRATAAAVLILALSPLTRYRPAIKPPPPDDTISIQMTPFVETPEQPPAPVPPVSTATPPQPIRAQSTPQPQSATPAPAASSANSSQPTSEPVAPAREAAPSSAVASPPTPTPAQAAPAAPHVDNEGPYVTGVRGYINSIKRYPTGRDASIQRPQGKTRIWFVLSRDGRLLDAGIDESSDSLLLDRTALATVQRGPYPPFPEGAFGGQASHRFTVVLEYTPGS